MRCRSCAVCIDELYFPTNGEKFITWSWIYLANCVFIRIFEIQVIFFRSVDYSNWYYFIFWYRHFYSNLSSKSVTSLTVFCFFPLICDYFFYRSIRCIIIYRYRSFDGIVICLCPKESHCNVQFVEAQVSSISSVWFSSTDASGRMTFWMVKYYVTADVWRCVHW